jgi:hypothetical protein
MAPAAMRQIMTALMTSIHAVDIFMADYTIATGIV